MSSPLGKQYRDGEVIVSQGEAGECMYVIQSGEVEVVRREGDREFCLATLRTGDFFGEMAVFEREVRSATVRAAGEAWVLTLEKKSFLRRIHEDPSLVFRILERMSHRIRDLNAELVRHGHSRYAESVAIPGADKATA
jgi:CRP-like cAMP-binding protein